MPHAWRPHFLSQVPRSARRCVAALLRTVLDQPDTNAVQPLMRCALDALEAKSSKEVAQLDAAQHDLLMFTAFCREIWSNTRKNA